jgi:hypothetical protein
LIVVIKIQSARPWCGRFEAFGGIRTLDHVRAQMPISISPRSNSGMGRRATIAKSAATKRVIAFHRMEAE